VAHGGLKTSLMVVSTIETGNCSLGLGLALLVLAVCETLEQASITNSVATGLWRACCYFIILSVVFPDGDRSLLVSLSDLLAR